jgi:N4-(beta-N-acetylglucosaminyl)-L-asparaginase
VLLLAVLALDKDGHVAAGVSTSGPPFKSPGRVGDSPLPGCGYYADKAGGAAATGDGETLMKFCPSFQVVQLMKKGESPQMACESVLKSMVEANGAWFEAGLVALDAKGNIGASGTIKEWKDIRTGQLYNGFPFATWSKGTNPVIITAPHLIC